MSWGWRLWGLLVLVGTVSANAQEAAPGPAPTAATPELAQQELIQMTRQYVVALNSRDADAVAKFWSDNAEFTQLDSGDKLTGRAAIRDGFAKFFAAKPKVTVAVELEGLRMATPDVATSEGITESVEPGEAGQRSAFTAVYIRKTGKWYIDSVRQRALAPDTAAEHLKPLGWLVGSWIDQTDDMTVKFVCQWTRNHAFLSRSYSVKVGDQVLHEGTQIIGWDPEQKKIRSWVFDSDAGFGEGIWTQTGNKWTVHATGTLPAGGKGSSVQMLTQVDDETCTWEVVSREVAGELLPNVPPVRLARQAVVIVPD